DRESLELPETAGDGPRLCRALSMLLRVRVVHHLALICEPHAAQFFQLPHFFPLARVSAPACHLYKQHRLDPEARQTSCEHCSRVHALRRIFRCSQKENRRCFQRQLENGDALLARSENWRPQIQRERYRYTLPGFSMYQGSSAKYRNYCETCPLARD